MKEFLADILGLAHLVPIALIFAPFFAPPSSDWLKYNLMVIPIILLDWNDYDSQCCFTVLERKLRGDNKDSYVCEPCTRPAFVYSKISKLLGKIGIEITQSQLNTVFSLIMLASWFTSYAKLSTIHNISLLDTSVGLLGKVHILFILMSIIIYIANIFYN